MKKRIVLVVDDEPQVGRIALMAVELAGFATLFAAGGPRALEIAAEYEGRIDALLTAYQMSGMNGCELAREIERRYPNIPVILMTGANLTSVNANPDWKLIAKPFSPREFLDTIRDALTKSARPVDRKPVQRESNTTGPLRKAGGREC